MNVRSDGELIKEFGRGNQQAFEELMSRYTAKAYSLALRLVRSQEDAEEVLQDVFVTVFRKIDGFEGKSSFSSWLYRVTVNASFMKLRKKRQDRTISMEEVLPQIQDSPVMRGSESQEGDTATQRSQVTHVLEQAIGKLPDEYRPVFVLRDIDGLSSKEVGKILNISIPAVKSRLHRSRLMIRKRLGEFYEEYRTGNGVSLRSAGNA